MTLTMYARSKGWPLEGVSVELSHERVHARDCAACEEDDDAMIEVFHRQTVLRGNLDPEQRDRLEQISRRCPVHRTLSSTIRIIDSLEVS